MLEIITRKGEWGDMSLLSPASLGEGIYSSKTILQKYIEIYSCLLF